jgi:hypothetical protein
MTNRKLKDVGFNPLLGYLLGLIVLVIFSEYIFEKTVYAKYIIILICISLQLQLSEKSRSDFLLSAFGNKTKTKIRILENLIVCIPFVAFLIYKNYFVEASSLFVFSIILAAISFQSNFNFSIPTPFSKKPFEFCVGFRKTFFIFPITYFLTIVAIHYDNLNLGLFSILLIFLTSLSYYAKPEQEYYVWVHAMTPRIFLKDKIIKATKNASLLVLPTLLGLVIFYPTEFEWILVIFLIGILFLWTIILAKYSVYPSDMNLPEGLIIAFCLYFPPLLIGIIPFFYSKSIKKLKIILND